jgi:HEAT repeat protein
VRAAAAQDLAQLGPDAREAVPALTAACLNDPDLAARVQAGVALWRVGRRALPALAALIEGLQKGDETTCWAAADCLGDMGSDAAEAVPALGWAFARTRQRLIRTSIALALERIDPAAASLVSFA